MHNHRSILGVEAAGFKHGRYGAMQKLIANVARKLASQAKLRLDIGQSLGFPA